MMSDIATSQIINVIFDDNEAFGAGGAIYQGAGLLNVSSSIFINNVAGSSGGAVNVSGGASNFDSVIFNSNSSTMSVGGALYAGAASSVTFAGINSFVNNQALSGGALYIDGAIFNLFEESSMLFTGNKADMSGGAMFVNSGSSVTFDGFALFSSNTAGTAGGALYNAGQISIAYSSFTQNKAISGGAVLSSGTLAVMNFNNASFRLNVSTNGGAIYNTFGSSINFNGVVNFTSNTANMYGGAIYNDNSAFAGFNNATVNFTSNSAVSGGAVYNQNADINFSGSNVSFSSNTATAAGGAIFNQNASIGFTGTNATFTYNNASTGAAIYNAANSTITATGGLLFFASNTAVNGGAVYNAGLIQISSAFFAANKADFGGAVYGYGLDSAISFGEAIFGANEANISGGAIALASGAVADFRNSYIQARHNKAGVSGGFIYLDNSQVIFGNAIIDANSSVYGGAIYAGSGSTLTFTSANDTAFNYSSAVYGGAIYLDNSYFNLESGSTMTFTGNFAASSGGAMYITNSGTVDLSSAYINAVGNNANAAGGFLYTDTNKVIFGDVNFASNSARGSSGKGGTLYATGAELEFMAAVTAFNYSSAAYGGAIYAGNSSTLTFNNEMKFVYNRASYGGAIYLDNSYFNLASGSTMTFTGNIAASSGGAMYITNSGIVDLSSSYINAIGNSANAAGGFLYTDTNKVIFGDVNFASNSARGSNGKGGTLYATGAELEFTGINTMFSYSSAAYGGAIYATNGSTLTFNNEAKFVSNRAVSGGAIYMDSSYFDFANGSTITFTGNVATSSGGAMYVYVPNGGILDLSNVYINATGNHADGSGGFLYTDSNKVIFGEVNFVNNTAHGINGLGGTLHAANGAEFEFTGTTTSFNNGSAAYGGALALANGSLANFSGTYLTATGNTAQSGGAMHLNNSQVIIGAALFSNNDPVQGGAIYAANGSTLTFGGAAVFSTNTANQGGALYIDNSILTYTSFSTLTFTGNTSTGSNSSGGAIYVRNSNNIDFRDAYVEAVGNRATGTNSAGGFMYAQASNIRFGEVYFASNTAARGGAIYGNSSYFSFEAATTTFSEGSASVSGGMLYLTNGSMANFAGTYFEATGNTAGTSGGFAYLNNSQIMFANAAMSNNRTTGISGLGGAIYAGNNSALIFDDSMEFSANSANRGGALYIDNSILDFINYSTLTFTGNTATGSNAYGGAIYAASAHALDFSGGYLQAIGNTAGSAGGFMYAQNSNVTFGEVYFASNTANYGGMLFGSSSSFNFTAAATTLSNSSASISGGAIALTNKSVTDFSSIYLTAENNKANISGGFIYADDSRITAVNAAINNNTAVTGGAIYASNGSSININGNTVFSSNTASGSNASGGAVYADNSMLSLNNVSFLFNKASGNNANGGALSVYGNTNGNISNSVFANNSATGSNALGGAVYISGTGSVTFTDVNFTSNTAASGGALALAQNSYAQIRALNGDVVFAGNTASSNGNDIYMTGNSILDFNSSANRNITLAGGIYGENGNIINKNGAGALNFLDSGTYEYYGTMNINNGVVNVINNTSISIGSLNIGAGGTYSVQSGTAAQRTNLGHLNIDGTLAMDVDLRTETADVISVSAAGNMSAYDGKVSIHNETSKIDLNIFGRVIASTSSRILLIETDGGSRGIFNNNPIEPPSEYLPVGYHWSLNYTDYYNSEWKDLYLIVTRATTFNDLPGLSHNQSEVAKTLDKIAYGMTFINDMWDMIDLLDTSSPAEVREALSQLNGSFYANAVSVALSGSVSDKLFARIKKRGDGLGKIDNSVWTQLYVTGFNFNGDSNSEGRFSSNGTGMLLGADLYTRDNLVSGAYFGYASNSLKQRYDSGSMSDVTFGAYGGLWVNDKINVQGDLSFGAQSYSAERDIKFYGVKTNSDFNSVSFRADVQGEYVVPLTDKINLKNYTGLQMGFVNSGSITESGGNAANLKVNSGSYSKIALLFGAGVADEISRLSWYAKTNLGINLSGSVNRLEASFINSLSEFDMDIRSAKIPAFSIGLSGGAEYTITKDFSAFTNVSFNNTGYFSGIGVNYSFSAWPWEK
ncbi:MAG: hypothetical protein FWF32_03335 [Endomicrobia bacterium]|nr:hypothetical protein [Endomicrobiia bacterium]